MLTTIAKPTLLVLDRAYLAVPVFQVDFSLPMQMNSQPMRLKKYGVVVGCERCKCVSDDRQGCFEVTVPLSDIETDIEGVARLRCSVFPEHHKVELEEWIDPSGQPLRISKKMGKRVLSALGFVGEHRVCGNKTICPSEVVRIVQKQNWR